MRLAALCLLLVACRSERAGPQWWQPSRVELHAGHSWIDHDRDVFDGASNTVGITVGWPLGMERTAYEQLARLEYYQRQAEKAQAELVERVTKEQTTALEKSILSLDVGPSGPAVDVHVEGGGEQTDALGTLVKGLSDSKAGKWTEPPMFVWYALAIVAIVAALAIAKKSGIRVPSLRKKGPPKP